MRERCSRYSFILDINSLDVPTLNSSSTQVLLVLVLSIRFPRRPAGLSSDLYPPRSIEGKSRTKLCQKRPQVPGLGHLQSYARFKGGKTKQGYQRMVGWCRLMVMADGDG